MRSSMWQKKSVPPPNALPSSRIVSAASLGRTGFNDQVRFEFVHDLLVDPGVERVLQCPGTHPVRLIERGVEVAW